MEVKILVGVSSTGKSTYINNELKGEEHNYIISDDNITNSVAKEINLKYSEIFIIPEEDEKIGEINSRYGEIIKIKKEEAKLYKMKSTKVYKKLYLARKEEYKRMEEKLKNAMNQKKPIIIDMPNLTKKDRKEIVERLLKYKKDDKKINIEQIVFLYGDIEIVKKISYIRSVKIELEGGDKVIPPEVHDYMDSIFEIPEEKEKYVNKLTIIDNEFILKRILIAEEHFLKRKINNPIEKYNKKAKKATHLKNVA